jgi:hypothetical protein
VLWSFAFAQPLLDLLGDTPEFFVARGNTRGDILVLAFALVLVPPLALTALEWLAGLLSRRLRDWLHLVLVGLLAAAFALQLIKDVSIRSALLLAVALALGALGALAYARTRAGPTALTVLGPAPLLFLLLFLLVSPVSKLVLPGGQASAAGVEVPGEPPVVVIVFDELAGFSLMGADGNIDAARYPSFARLARHATWYRNATGVADYTDRAVPAILTGERPDKGALPIADDHPESLFTLLGGDYDLDVTEPMTDICPRRLCPEEEAERDSTGRRLRALGSDLSLVSLHLLLPGPLAGDLPAVDRSFGNFRTTADGDEAAAADHPDTGAAGRGLAALAAVIDRVEIARAFEHRLARAKPSGQLFFFHIQLPHNPYHYLPDGHRYPETVEGLPGLTSEGQPAGGGWTDDAALARQGFERYLLQVGYTDRLLGRLLDAMHASGIYDRSLVAVLADHGASFQPGLPLRAANPENLASIASIPLLIKSPGQTEGEVDDGNVNATDVLPTIAERLDVELPWPTEGRPATAAAQRGTVRLQPHYGDADLELPFAEFLRRRDALVDAMARDFGTGADGLYADPTAPRLVGTDVGGMETASGADFRLDGGGLLAAVDPSAPLVPALVTGELSGVPAAARLAVAVDGRVAASAVRWEDDDRQRFSAIVPPSAFARGANAVDLIAVLDGRAMRVRGQQQAAYRLAQRGGSETIVDGSGRELPVGSGAGGAIDKLEVGQTDVRVGGWAGDAERGLPAQRVLAFAGDRFLGAARPSLARADVAERVDPKLGRSGFELRGWTVGPEPDSAEAPVRAFAIVGGRALEIPRASP